MAAFTAHQLSLGRARIWQYFDDPEDAAFDSLSRVPQVTAARCDDTRWAIAGTRPERHQNRLSSLPPA